jgi:hypothetical protein
MLVPEGATEFSVAAEDMGDFSAGSLWDWLVMMNFDGAIVTAGGWRRSPDRRGSHHTYCGLGMRG